MIKLTGYESFDSVYVDPKYIVSIERLLAIPDPNIQERTKIRLALPKNNIVDLPKIRMAFSDDILLVLETPDTVYKLMQEHDND